ncbi:hypothetical protein H9P43_005038 [Blastocladiella emersonii ATCC 22665]|nr:hypothetical protein H9P43_005022 [Blastocladiella emersonii ATCC 22665]KAI9179695.1 hypothetical protein H9P43_005025 [Blastocladiella emersonii ATCC 22665]KAI9179708.1 hypothetical protein H9P43_005038 [Blastocladiella emersonii ATCC 22665]
MSTTTTAATATDRPNAHKMHYARLGKTGLQVSRICVGMMSYGSSDWEKWVLDADKALPLLRAAWDHGINFFDTADVYSSGMSERLLGQFMRENGDIKRSEIVIATKVFFQVGDTPTDQPALASLPAYAMANKRGLSRKYIFEAVEASLARLGTDYIDLYQIHRWDYNTPIEETMGALHDLVKAGKVRYIGASSMYAWQFAKAQAVAERNGWTQFVSMQNLVNLAYREEEREMLPLCRDMGVGVIPWSPLAGGLLSDKGKSTTSLRAQTDTLRNVIHLTESSSLADGGSGETVEAAELSNEDRAKAIVAATDDRSIAALRKVAAARGVPASQVALAWVLAKPEITAPIVGINKVAYLEDAVAALSITLTAEEKAALEAPYLPVPVRGNF